MPKLNYIYENFNKTLQPEQMYPNERILSKNENIKWEDDKGNKEYEALVYFTNFRIVCLSGKFTFDIPLIALKEYYIYRPFWGSPYIYIVPKTIDFSSNMQELPMYLIDNYTPEYLRKGFSGLPGYVMIKFRDDSNDMKKSFELLEMGIKSKEYLIKYSKPNPIEEDNNQSMQNSKIFTTSIVKGIGMSRITNMMNAKQIEQTKIIQGSFNDPHKFRENAQELIELAKVIRAKLNNFKGDNESSKEINTILSKIGYVDPVTKEVAGSEYYIKVAEQINNYFSDYFLKNPQIKVITLIDAYCIYNRARGGNTISPKDMVQALKTFPSVSKKIMIKNYNNEMIVLHTKDYSNQNILKSIKNKMSETGVKYVTLNMIQEILNVKNFILEKILIDDMVNEGILLIDESDLDVNYYLNKIINYKI